MNIFVRELKANRRALMIWCICLFSLVASGMMKYTAYTAGGQSSQLLNGLPHSLKALLGFGRFNPTTMPGYFAMLFLYVEITVAIHAALIGCDMIAKEERDKTAEFLMTKPIGRSVVLSSKLAAAFVNIVIVNLITLASSVVLVRHYNKGSDISREILLFMLSMLLVQLIFMTLGAALAAGLSNSKSAGSMAIGIVLVGYVISRITDLTNRLNFLNVLSPFKYYSYTDIVNGRGLNMLIVLLSSLLIAGLVGWAYLSYQKRDVQI